MLEAISGKGKRTCRKESTIRLGASDDMGDRKENRTFPDPLSHSLA